MNLHYSMKWERKMTLNGSLPSVPMDREGCRLTGEFRAEVTKPRPEAARREGRGWSTRCLTSAGHRRAEQAVPTAGASPGISAAGTSLQRKDAWLPREGPSPSSVRCRCAGLGPVGDAARGIAGPVPPAWVTLTRASCTSQPLCQAGPRLPPFPEEKDDAQRGPLARPGSKS